MRDRTVLYARVSSKEQEQEGFSIPAQLKLLREYAKGNPEAATSSRLADLGKIGGRPHLSVIPRRENSLNVQP